MEPLKKIFASTTKLSLLFSAVFLVNCSEKKPEDLNQKPTDELAKTINFDLSQAEQTFWSKTQIHLENGNTQCRQHAEQTKLFLDTPTTEKLSALQVSWQNLEQQLAKLHSLSLFANTSPEIFSNIHTLIYKTLAEPIQPGYLDRFGTYLYSGIVFDIGFSLSKESLNQQNGFTDDEEVLLGLYAIEFMLFGENNTRSSQDYIQASELSQKHIEQKLASITEIPNNRRRKLLNLQTEILCEDLEQITAHVTQNQSQDMKAWRTLSPQQQISKARSSLELGRTELLLALAKLQTDLNRAQQEHETIDTQTADTRTSTATEEILSPEKNIAGHVRSLIDATVYFSDIERAAALTQLEGAATLLEQLPFVDSLSDAPEHSSDNNQNTSLLLQDVYTKLKTAY